MADQESEPARGQQPEPLRNPDFARFWAADAITTLGIFTTGVAVDVLVVQVLHASETEVGLIRAVQFLPYLVVGLLAGTLVDRWRRRPTLILTNLGAGLCLLVIPLFWALGWLTLPAVATVLFIMGSFGVFRAAAEQTYVPDLVTRDALITANARIGQAATVSETSGPALGGALVGLISAPFALGVNAASNLIAVWTLASIKTPETLPDSKERLTIFSDIGQGVRFMYRHRTLAPLALSTHVWFIANSAAITVFALFALRQLGLSPALYGVVLACAGIGGLVGAFCAPKLARSMGEGPVIVVGRTITPLAWSGVVLIPDAEFWSVMLLALAKALYGFGLGLENPAEMSYWQAVTPREILGRVNATRRSANRTMAVVGSLSSGVLAAVLGYRTTIWIAVMVFVIAIAVIVFSPVRQARVAQP